MSVLITGNAGFIGFHTTKLLLENGQSVVGIDVVNDYYNPKLKEDRLKILDQVAKGTGTDYTFIRMDLTDSDGVNTIFAKHKPHRVINLAAQAGVRHSLTHPHDYIASNITAFTNVLEACRHHNVKHLTYASTSSVYGANTDMPFSEHKGVDHPLQLYAATKRANELMAHAYSHLFRLPTTGLRFFTVYGPWGRPDMALFLFTENILNEKPINVFNYGNHTRDFTYVDDIAAGILRVNNNPAVPNPNWSSDIPDPASSDAPFRIYNIGNSMPVKLSSYIEAIEEALDKKAIINLLPLQPGDLPDTYADVSELIKAVDYKPATSVKDGVAAFVNWYRNYYQL